MHPSQATLEVVRHGGASMPRLEVERSIERQLSISGLDMSNEPGIGP